jgi:hypothetical protein
MRDQQAAAGLTPPKTLSGLVEKYSAQGKSGNALWQEIYNSSMRSNPGVDSRFQSGDAAVPFFLWDGSDE